MPPELDDVLAANAGEYEVHGPLHDVHPHAVWEVSVDGTRAVCKLARGPEADPALEGRVMQYVGRETSVPVPRVLGVGDGYFVAAWCDDAPESGTRQGADAPARITRELAHTLGAGLATLHVETGFDRYGPPRFDGELVVDGRDDWTGALRDCLAEWREYLAAYGEGGPVAQVIDLVDERRGAFDGAGTPVLTHGWYTPEHVGNEDGRVTCVLDWEHALAAPGEYDYWRAAMPLFGNHEHADGAEGAFRAGYEAVRPLPPGFDERRPAYEAVVLAYYLVSGRVQRQHDDVALARLSDRVAEAIGDRLDALRTTGR